MASQFSSTNGTDIKTSASPTGPPKTLPPLSTKPPTLTPQTQLTGAAALNRQRSSSPGIMSTDHKNNTPTATASTTTANEPLKQPPNPAALITAGFGMSTPTDAPKEATPSRELGSLPGVAAAAAAMEEHESPTATTMSGTDGAGLTSTAAPDTSSIMLHEQYPPLQPQPPPQQQQDRKDTITPATPQFVNPTTPVTPFSPSGSSAGARGKHTCPHCMKTFTRHHNLKSHLLTHAHEKPYLCTTCQARFRRLHDLKRHSKLHTGERPHVCTKCGRRFARGDALARHARGEGGCAGRRGSMSGLNEDGSIGVGGEHEEDMDLEGLMDDPDGDVMMDDVPASGTGGNATVGGGRRRQSLPSLRTDLPNTPMTPRSAYTTVATPLNPNSSTSTASSATLTGRHPHHLHHQHHHPHHNNTYPPPSARSLATPATTNPQSTTSTTSSSTPGQTALSASAPSPPLFTPGISFNRAPAPATTSTPSATAATTTTTTTTAAGNTVLSPAGVLTDSPGAVSPGMTRERTPSFTSSGGFLSPPGPVVASSGTAGGRTSGAGAAGGGVGSSNVFASGMDGVWAYIRTLEDRIRVLEERAGSRE